MTISAPDSLFGLLSAHAESGERSYLEGNRARASYAQVIESARRLGARMASLPQLSGARKAIGVQIQSQELLAQAIWAAVSAEISVVFLPNRSDAAALRKAMFSAGVEAVLIDQPLEADVPGALDIGALMASSADIPAVAADAHEPAAFLFQTSGTTGEPKWVRCEFRQCARAVHAMVDVGALDHARGQTVFLTPPLYHSYGLSSLLEYTAVGATVVFPPMSSPFGPAGDLQSSPLAQRVTAIEGVPHFYSQLARLSRRVRLPVLSHAGLGGGPLDVPVMQMVIAAYPDITVSVRYGLTETPSVATHKVFRPPYEGNWRSSGRVVPAYEVSIQDPSGVELPAGVEGEIVIRGDCVASYVGDERAELRTGDLGMWSDGGELVVTGRQSAYLKYRGYRLSPEQIESCINTCEGVLECRVLLRDKRLVAEVVCSDSSALARIAPMIRHKLPLHAVPEQYEPVECIARTASGKIKRHANP